MNLFPEIPEQQIEDQKRGQGPELNGKENTWSSIIKKEIHKRHFCKSTEKHAGGIADEGCGPLQIA